MRTPIESLLLLLLCLLIGQFLSADAFLIAKTKTVLESSPTCLHVASSTSTKFPRGEDTTSRDGDPEHHFLLKPFATASGEVVNPYQVLNVPRNAERTEIKSKFKALAKRYHPDGVRHRDILPGKCNNEEEVREEWERILLSYHILSDPKTRKRYDRNEMVADPGAAFQRAAVGAAVSGMTTIGKGLFSLGKTVIQKATAAGKEQQQ